MNIRWNIVEKKLCNLTQTIVSRRLHSASLASEGSCLTRAVSIARSFVSVTTKSWTLFKTVWRVSVLVNKELFISNIHRKTACNGGERVTKSLQAVCYHVTILQVYLAFSFLHLCLMISGNARGHLHTLKKLNWFALWNRFEWKRDG